MPRRPRGRRGCKGARQLSCKVLRQIICKVTGGHGEIPTGCQAAAKRLFALFLLPFELGLQFSNLDGGVLELFGQAIRLFAQSSILLLETLELSLRPGFGFLGARKLGLAGFKLALRTVERRRELVRFLGEQRVL